MINLIVSIIGIDPIGKGRIFDHDLVVHLMTIRLSKLIKLLSVFETFIIYSSAF
jgi:hypothetical protein